MTVIQGLLRSVPFFVIFLMVRLLPIPADVVGENVRLGLLVFGLTGLACSVWALVDALSMPLRRAIARWVVTAIVVALAQPVLGHAESPGGYSSTDAWADLLSLSVFMFGMVLLPATVVALAAHRWLIAHDEADEVPGPVLDLRTEPPPVAPAPVRPPVMAVPEPAPYVPRHAARPKTPQNSGAVRRAV